MRSMSRSVKYMYCSLLSGRVEAVMAGTEGGSITGDATVRGSETVEFTSLVVFIVDIP